MNIAKKLVTNDALTFRWADGSVTTLDWDDFSSDMNKRAMQHGYKQKLGDAYSGATSVAEAKGMMDAVLQGLLQNDWNRKGGAFGGIWVEALAQATGETYEDALDAWSGYTDEEKLFAKKHPDVKQAKLEIELERAKAKPGAKQGISL